MGEPEGGIQWRGKHQECGLEALGGKKSILQPKVTMQLMLVLGQRSRGQNPSVLTLILATADAPVDRIQDPSHWPCNVAWG